MNISLAKALKLKSRLGGRLAKVQSQITLNNSTEAENLKSDDKNKLEELFQVRDRLVAAILEIKMVLYTANTNIQKELYLMAEKKGEINFYSVLPAKEGMHYNGYNENKILYTAYLNQAKIDQIVLQLQKEVEALQDSIDDFNAVTKVTLPDEYANL